MEDIRFCILTGCKIQKDIFKSFLLEKFENSSLLVLSKYTIDSLESVVYNNDIFSDDSFKIVVLKDFVNFYEDQKLNNNYWKNILGQVPPNRFIVIEDDVSDSVRKFVKENGKIFDFKDTIESSDAIKLTETILKNNSKNAEDGLVINIVDMLSDESKKINIYNLHSYLYKLSILTENRKIQEDLLNCVFPIISKKNIWNIFKNIDNKNMNYINNFIFSNIYSANNQEGEIRSIIYIIYWRYKLLLLCKTLKENGNTNEDIIKNISSIIKKTKEEEKPVYSDKIISSCINEYYGNSPSINKYSYKKLFMILNILESTLKYMRYVSNIDCLTYLFNINILFITDNIDLDIYYDTINFIDKEIENAK